MDVNALLRWLRLKRASVNCVPFVVADGCFFIVNEMNTSCFFIAEEQAGIGNVLFNNTL